MGIPYTRTSIIQGNNLYKGNPRKYKGNHLQREINYTRKPLIYGNSCSVNALSNKGAHPRPSLFEESSVHLETSKNHRKNQRNQTIQRGQDKNYQNHKENQTNQNKQTFRPMSSKVDMGLGVLFFCFVLVFFRWFLIVFALTSLTVLVSLVCPMVFDVLKLLHRMFKLVPGNS